MPHLHALKSDSARSDRAGLLWIDMRSDVDSDSLSDLLRDSCALRRLGPADDITDNISALEPDVICF